MNPDQENPKLSDNIIQFPKEKAKAAMTKPEVMKAQIEDIDTSLSELHLAKVEQMVSVLVMDLLNNFGKTSDINKNELDKLPSEQEFVSSLALCLESIRAMVYKTYGIEHGLHKTAQELIEIQSDGTALYEKKPVLILQTMDEDGFEYDEEGTE